ncbi:MAG: hypothetical protein Kow0047_04520 [Anaerolineae bacterium]
MANIAWGDKEDGSDAVPEASDEELELFRQARRHLPPSVFDEAKWKRAVGDDESLWRRVVYVLNRGGRFEPLDRAYEWGEAGTPLRRPLQPLRRARGPGPAQHDGGALRRAATL